MSFEDEKLHQMSKALSRAEKEQVILHMPDSVLKAEQERRERETDVRVDGVFHVVNKYALKMMTYENKKAFLLEIKAY